MRHCLWLAALTVLLGWLASTPAANAQHPDPSCNAFGDDNDLLYCVFVVEPRFGGFSVVGSDGSTIRVWLTGDDPTEEAAQRVLTAVNGLWERNFESTRVQTADYNVGQLRTWFDSLLGNPADLIRAVDLDQSSNRLVVFAPDLEEVTVTSITDHVANLGIPADAVVVERAPTAQPPPPEDPVPVPGRAHEETSGAPEPITRQRLDRALNPFVAGGKISSGGGSCTAAFTVSFFNASGEEEEGFLTAGHCADEGLEIHAYETGATGQQLIGNVVRNIITQNADAAYVKKAGPDHITIGVGYIARPIEENTSGSGATQYQRRLDPGNPYFEVSGAARSVVGDEVHKVGNTTGWTSGTITR